ncbi:FtsJ-like methyltransferase [Rhizoctonia solani]|uniref:FtsJ-like methyltransferase n=1 Tax=Rhizoctonia solani TaxID=456999 RepID=A0A8H8P2V7_9AGAM|nr:FtsJ-like methyltransferase [Rhizoctonia solani]QRW23415.1 FtsJ-like methyltransferase [Rhizoctonia solani]
MVVGPYFPSDVPILPQNNPPTYTPSDASTYSPTSTSTFSVFPHPVPPPNCLVLAGYVLPPFNPYIVPGSGPPPKTIGLNNMFSSHEETYMHKMRFALEEMDRKYSFVRDGSFLDLGCCPGGFSTYILSKYPNAQGMGISLPIEYGGHSLAVPLHLRDRLQVHWADVTMFDHAPSLVQGFWDTTIFQTSPVPTRAFDFVIVDGHQPPSMLAGDPRESWGRDRLLISQLLAGLRAIKPTGTLFAKLSLQVSVPLMERIVVALSRLTPIPLRAVKPTSIYATAGTFYVLLHAPIPYLCDRLIRILEGLWYFMTFSGPNHFGRGLKESDMDLIATYGEVLAAKPRLNLLFQPIEEIRKAAKAARN